MLQINILILTKQSFSKDLVQLFYNCRNVNTKLTFSESSFMFLIKLLTYYINLLSINFNQIFNSLVPVN